MNQKRQLKLSLNGLQQSSQQSLFFLLLLNNTIIGKMVCLFLPMETQLCVGINGGAFVPGRWVMIGFIRRSTAHLIPFASGYQ